MLYLSPDPCGIPGSRNRVSNAFCKRKCLQNRRKTLKQNERSTKNHGQSMTFKTKAYLSVAVHRLFIVPYCSSIAFSYRLVAKFTDLLLCFVVFSCFVIFCCQTVAGHFLQPTAVCSTTTARAAAIEFYIVFVANGNNIKDPGTDIRLYVYIYIYISMLPGNRQNQI